MSTAAAIKDCKYNPLTDAYHFRAKAKKWTQFVSVSAELIEDKQYFDELLGGLFKKAFEKAESQAFVAGDGVKELGKAARNMALNAETFDFAKKDTNCLWCGEPYENGKYSDIHGDYCSACHAPKDGI